MRFFKQTFVLLLFLCWSVSAFAQGGAMSAETLSGVVYTTASANNPNAAGFDPIVNAQVKIAGTDLIAETNHRGIFVFPKVPHGQMALIVYHPNYQPVEKVIEHGSSERGTQLRFELLPVGYEKVGDTVTGPGTVYVAFAQRKSATSKHGDGGSPSRHASGITRNLHAATAAIAAGTDPYKLDGGEGIPKPGKGGAKNSKESMTPVSQDANSMMIFPPNNPKKADFKPFSSPTYWLTFSKDGRYLFTSNAQRQVQILDARSNQVLASLPIQGFVTDLKTSPKGNYVMASVMGTTPGVLMINVKKRLPQAFVPVDGGGPWQPRAVVMSPQEDKLYVITGTSNDGTLQVIDPYAGKVLAKAKTGANPTGLALSPDGSSCYVVNAGAGSMSVFDTRDLSPIANVRVGVNPQKVAVSPDGSRIVVTNKGSANASFIDGNSLTVYATPHLATGPMDVAFTLDGRMVYVSCRDAAQVFTLDGMRGGVLNQTRSQPRSFAYGIAIRP